MSYAAAMHEVLLYPAIIAVGVRGLTLVDAPMELWKMHMDYSDFEDCEEVTNAISEPGIYRCEIAVHLSDLEMVLEIRNAAKIADVLAIGMREEYR